MRAPVELRRRRAGLLSLTTFTLTLAAIPGAAVIGERLRENKQVATAVPPASQPVDYIETGSVVGTDTIGAMIEKLDRKDAAQAHQEDHSRTSLAVIQRKNSLSAIR